MHAAPHNFINNYNFSLQFGNCIPRIFDVRIGCLCESRNHLADEYFYWFNEMVSDGHKVKKIQIVLKCRYSVVNGRVDKICNSVKCLKCGLSRAIKVAIPEGKWA